MPKGKNAAALFEVIGRSPTADKGPSATRTPSWWWKRPAKSASPGPSSPSEPMLRVDHDHQLVHFSLSTTTSLLIAFGVLVVIVIAFIVGEHVGRKQSPMTAITSEALMKSSANPQVMNVPPGAGSPTDQGDATNDQQTASQQPADQSQEAPTTADRKAGLYYVIMQSYPPDLRSDATEAQTILLTHGIPCTIEGTPARLHPKGWISLIGTTGFPSVKEAESKAYVHQIEASNNELHGKFKKLQPVAYKWR